MVEAVVFSFLCILALFGIHKLVELFLCLGGSVGEKTGLIVYKIDRDEKNAEMIIRALATDSTKFLSVKKVGVYIVYDGEDTEVLEICKRTAEQYDNIFVGKLSDAERLLDD